MSNGERLTPLDLPTPWSAEPVGEGVWRLSDGVRTLVVTTVARDDDSPAYARTDHLNVSVGGATQLPLPEAAERALKALVGWFRATGAAPPPTFWILPGHLGTVKDLPIRARSILTRSRVWYVEEGKTAIASEIARDLGVPVAEIHEVDGNARWVDGAGDACLFGVDEGAPAFLDPGRSLLASVPEGVTVRSVGGPSALGAALSRLAVDLETFRFVGHVGSVGSDGRLRRALAWSLPGSSPIVFFASGEWCRTHGSPVWSRVGRRRGSVSIAGDLTVPGEGCVRWSPPAAAPAIPFEKTVVALSFPPFLSLFDRGRLWFAASSRQ